MCYPRHDDRAPDSALPGYLAKARALLGSLSTTDLTEPGDLVSADFEHLRWFELPAGCLTAAGG